MAVIMLGILRECIPLGVAPPLELCPTVAKVWVEQTGRLYVSECEEKLGYPSKAGA